jgi:uncharacterized protein (TIGR04255 family)
MFKINYLNMPILQTARTHRSLTRTYRNVNFCVNSSWSGTRTPQAPLDRRLLVAKYNGRLANPPIVYAFCQIRFPPVGTIDETKATDIHASLREQYPHRTAQNIVELPFVTVGGGGAPTLKQAWFMYDRPKSSGFVLEPTTFAYRTTAYVDFEHFVGEAVRGLKQTFEILRPTLIDRVGLRFIDLIEGSDDADLDNYIEAPLLGYKPLIEGFKPLVNQQMVVGKTTSGDIVFRYSRAQHPIAVPPELMDPTLTGLKKPQPNAESVIIDIDHFKDNADLDPDLGLLEQLIRDLQGPMSTLFKDAATPFACEQWNKTK